MSNHWINEPYTLFVHSEAGLLCRCCINFGLLPSQYLHSIILQYNYWVELRNYWAFFSPLFLPPPLTRGSPAACCPELLIISQVCFIWLPLHFYFRILFFHFYWFPFYPQTWSASQIPRQSSFDSSFICHLPCAMWSLPPSSLCSVCFHSP